MSQPKYATVEELQPYKIKVRNKDNVKRTAVRLRNHVTVHTINEKGTGFAERHTFESCAAAKRFLAIF